MNMKTRTLKSVTITSLLALSLTGFEACNSKSEQTRTEEAVENTGDAIEADTKETADEVSAKFQVERDKAVANLEEQRDKLDQKIDELSNKMDKKSNKADKTVNRQVDKLKTEREELTKDIDKAKNATADAWQDVKAGFKKAGRSIGNAFDEAGERLDNN